MRGQQHRQQVANRAWQGVGTGRLQGGKAGPVPQPFCSAGLHSPLHLGSLGLQRPPPQWQSSGQRHQWPFTQMSLRQGVMSGGKRK